MTRSGRWQIIDIEIKVSGIRARDSGDHGSAQPLQGTAYVKKIFQNPIATSFLAISVPLFLFGLFTGFGLQALQLLIVPYTYDYSRGVGKLADQWLSGGLFGLQVVVVAMALSIPSVSRVVLRRVLWAFGVLLVCVYLFVTIVAYVSTGLH